MRFIVVGSVVLALAAGFASQAAGSNGGGGSGSQGGSESQGGSRYSGGSSSGQGSQSGGAAASPGPAPQSTANHPVVKGYKAKIVNGVAYAPSYAPRQVQEAIWAGDKIRNKSYCYGGGHGQWNDSCYDCSGSVSFVLHSAHLLSSSMDSTEFESWGDSGQGQWITVYTNPSHAFVEIAGIRFDTSSYEDPHPPPGTGPRWRPLATDTSGFEARHPAGL